MNLLPQKVASNLDIANNYKGIGRYDMALSRYYYHYLLRAKNFLMDNTSVNTDAHFDVADSHKFIITELHNYIIINRNSRTANQVRALLNELKMTRKLAEYNSLKCYTQAEYNGIETNTINNLERLYITCNIA